MATSLPSSDAPGSVRCTIPFIAAFRWFPTVSGDTVTAERDRRISVASDGIDAEEVERNVDGATGLVSNDDGNC